MRTVAIINQKGGCGKTTTSINLAACLAHLRHKTLLVDMDPQGHCGVGLAVPEEQIERTVYDAMMEPQDGKPADIGQIVWQIASDFDLCPSNIRLAGFEQVFANRPGRDERLRLALAKVQSVYQWCIIDCPPSVGLLTFNALKACDEVIVPVETGFFSLHGLAKMMETLDVMRNKCGRDIKVRILPTLYDTRTKLAREVLSELRAKFKRYLMESAVNFNTKLKEAASFGQPITEYDPGSRGYKDFVNLARELMGHSIAESRPIGEERLSRPQELVQRARQLAQLTHTQFGRNTGQPSFAAQAPASPASPASSAAASVERGVLRHEPPNFEPDRYEPARNEFDPYNPADELGNQYEMPPYQASEFQPAAAPQAPVPNVMTHPSMRLTGINWPPATELLISNRHLQSLAVTKAPAPIPFVAASEAKMSTSAKIEDYYGVKQIGADVIFTAHFDQARSVLLAGDFNNWMPQSTPMNCGSRPGDWRKVLPLAPGRYKYRLVVDGKWVTDPNNRYVESNQFGELDNVIEVERAGVQTAIAA